MDLAWTRIAKKWRQHCRTSSAVEATGPRKKRATTEYLEKRPGVRNGDSRIQVQLEEDGGDGKRTELDRTEWSVAFMVHLKRQRISQVSQSLTVQPKRWNHSGINNLRNKRLGLGWRHLAAGVKHYSAQSATTETLLVYLLIYYLRQGSYVYACVCLFVCLLHC